MIHFKSNIYGSNRFGPFGHSETKTCQPKTEKIQKHSNLCQQEIKFNNECGTLRRRSRSQPGEGQAWQYTETTPLHANPPQLGARGTQHPNVGTTALCQATRKALVGPRGRRSRSPAQNLQFAQTAPAGPLPGLLCCHLPTKQFPAMRDNTTYDHHFGCTGTKHDKNFTSENKKKG